MNPTSNDMTIPPDKPGYIISLDKYDFSYLHTYDRRTEVPLWTLQGPEYMEFQLFAEEIPSDPDGEKLDSRRCHICEVDVPVAYLEAHNVSTKHQLYSAIVQTSLDRFRKQVAGDFSLVQSCAPQPSTYYCESCAVAVDRSNNLHEVTSEHMNNKNRDDIMNKFMLIYQNPNNFENVCEEFKVNVKIEDAVKQSKLDWWDEVFLYPKRVNPVTVHKIHYIDDYTIEISAVSGAKLAVAFDNFHGFCEDADEKFCRICRVPIKDKYEHMNDDEHIKQVIAPIEDEHCIRQLDQKLSHCILCNENLENRETHVRNEKHENALFNALIDDEDYECMRKDFEKYDTNINIYKDWWEDVFMFPKKVNPTTAHKINYIDDYTLEISAKSGAKVAVDFDNFHGFRQDAGKTLCCVCRVLIEDKYKHMNDDGHIKKITAPIGDKHCIRQHRRQRYYQWDYRVSQIRIYLPDTCHNGERVPAGGLLSVVDSDVGRTRHAINRSAPSLQVQSACSTPAHSLFKEEFKKGRCKKQHNPLLHAARRSRRGAARCAMMPCLASDRASTACSLLHELDPILNHCMLCNEIIENNQFHISTEKHITALNASILDVTSEVKKTLADNSMVVSAFDKKVYSCNACQIYVEHNNLEEHIHLDCHIESLSKTTKRNRDLKLRKKQAAAEHCDICNLSIKGGKKEMKVHKKTQDHRYLAWLPKKDKKLHHHLTKINLVNNATCKVCRVIIDADKLAADKHIASSKHQTEHKMLLQMNKMEVVDQKYILCNACDTLILPFEDLSHTVRKVHRNNLAKNKTSFKSAKGDYTENNLLEKVSAQNDPDEVILTQTYLEKKGDNCYCKVCDKTMELKDLNVHISCEWHLKNIASELNENKETVIKKEDSYQTVTDETNYDVPAITTTHVHQNQTEDVYIGNYCTVCKVSISRGETGRKRHQVWSDHRYQVYLDQMEKGTRYHHHMKHVLENKVICKVCKIEIELNKISIQKHVESDEHCEKYKTLSNNILIKISDARVLCTLCNFSLLILDEINHLTTRRHLRNLNTHGYRFKSSNPETYTSCSDTSVELENISVETLQDNNLVKTGHEYYCQACCVGVEYNIVNIHVDSDMHRINLNKIQLAELKDSDKPVRKPEPLDYMYKLNDDSLDVECKYCNVRLNFDDMAIHRKANSHKQNVTDILHLNTMIRIYHVSFCECCREIVKRNFEYEHFTSQKHARNLSSMNSRMDTAEVLEIAESMFREYLATFSRNKSNKLLPKSSDENSDCSTSEESKDDEFPKSTIASNPVSNIGLDEAGNCESESSYASAKTSMTVNKPSSNTEIISNDEIKSDSLTSYLTSDFAHLFCKDNLMSLICQICDCVVSSRYDLFMEHVQGMKHTTKYESFLLENDIKESVDSEKKTIRHYHCFTCGIDLLNSHLIPHITSESHKINLVYTQLSSSGELKQDLETVSKIHRTYFMEETDGDVFCKLCDSEVQSKDIVKHIQNSVHQGNIEAVLHENETRKVGHLIVCNICTMGVKEGNEIEHIYSESHKKRMKIFAFPKTKFAEQNVTLSQGYLCGVCNVEILGRENVIKLHNEGIRHKRNMLKSAEATAQSPFNTLVQNVQPQERVEIKTHTFCKICKIKYEDNPDDKRKHEGSLFHRTCQDFLKQTSNNVTPPDTKDTKTELQIADCSNNTTFFNFIPDVPIYYWCENYDKDPFYLMSTVLRKSKWPTVVQNQSSESKNYITQSESQENIDSRNSCSAPVPPASLDECLLGAMHRQNGAIDDVAEVERNETVQQMTRFNFQENAPIFNFIPDVSIYYWCETYDKDPFYLMSAASKTVVQNQSICSAKVGAADVFQHVLGARHKKNVATKENSKAKKSETAKQITRDQDFLKQTPNDVTPPDTKDTKTELQIADCSNNMTFFNFIPDVPIYYWCENYDKDPFYLMSTVLKKSKWPTVVQNQSSESKNYITQSESRENIDSRNSCSAPVLPASLDKCLLGAMHRQNGAIDDVDEVERNETVKQMTRSNFQENMPVFSFIPDVPISYWCENYHKDPFYLMSAVLKNSKLPTVVQNQSNETKNQITQPKSQENIDSKYLANYYCSICSAKVGAANVFQHLLGARHRENAATKENATAKKSETAKQITQSQENIDSANAASHSTGAKHTENVAIAKKNITNSNTVSSTEHTNHIVNDFCTVCKVRVPSGTANIALHVKGARHQENVAITEKTKTTSHTTSSTKHTGHVVNGFCTVCKVNVPGGSVNIAQHVSGARHKENVAITAKTRTTSNTFSSTEHTGHIVNGFCTVCKVNVPGGSVNIAQHVSGARHKENVAITAKTKTTSNTTSSTEHTGHVVNGFCTVCKVNVPGGSVNIAQHVSGARHKENVAITAKTRTTSNTTSSTEHTSHVVNGFCTACKVEVPTGSVSIAQHVSGARHKENVATTAKTRTTSNTTSSTEHASHVVNGFCTACKVEVPTGSVSIAQHVSGARHKENVAITAKNRTTSNTTSSREHTSHVVNGFCTVCKVNVSDGSCNIAEHVSGARHKQNMAITAKNITTSNINSRTEPANIVLHVIEDNHKENLAVAKKITSSKEMVVPTQSRRQRYMGIYNVIPQTKKEQLCTLCNIIVSNTIKSLEEHLASATHKENSENTLRNSATLFTSSNTTQANSRESSANRQSNRQNDKYTCQICNLTFPNCPSQIADHLAGVKHFKNAIKLNIDTIPIDMKPEKQAPLVFNVQPSSFTKAAELYTPAKIAAKKMNSQASNDLNNTRPSTSFTNNITTSQPEPASNETSQIDKDIDSEHDDDGFYICKICNVLIENNQTDIQSHLNSFRHHTKVDEMKEKLKEDSQEVKLYYCEVCKCKVANNPVSIKTHNESALHKKRFDDLLSINIIKIRDNKVCYCELCDLYFNKFSVLSHIVKDKHKILVGEAKLSPAVD